MWGDFRGLTDFGAAQGKAIRVAAPCGSAPAFGRVEAPAARLIDAWTEVPAYLRGNAKDPGLKPLCIWVAGMTKTDTEILSPSTSLRAQNDERRTEADFSAALRNDKQERQIRRFWLRQNDGKEGGTGLADYERQPQVLRLRLRLRSG